MPSEPTEHDFGGKLPEFGSRQEEADYFQEHPEHIGAFIEAVREGRIPADRAVEVTRELVERSTIDGRTGLKNETALVGSQGNGGDLGKLARQCEREAWEELKDLGGDTDRAEGRQFAIAVVDLDEFGSVNEAFGQERGNRLLEDVGTTLTAQMRPGEEAYRLGGGADEFALLLPGVATPEGVERAIAAIQERMPKHPVTGGPVRFNDRKGIEIYDTRQDGPENAQDRFRRALTTVKGE